MATQEAAVAQLALGMEQQVSAPWLAIEDGKLNAAFPRC
jgi:hypothetical protein